MIVIDCKWSWSSVVWLVQILIIVGVRGSFCSFFGLRSMTARRMGTRKKHWIESTRLCSGESNCCNGNEFFDSSGTRKAILCCMETIVTNGAMDPGSNGTYAAYVSYHREYIASSVLLLAIIVRVARSLCQPEAQHRL